MTLISTDILAVIALCITLYMANHNISIGKSKNKAFNMLVILTILLLLLEILSVFMALSANTELTIPHIIINILGFSLSPLVPYLFLFIIGNSSENKIICNRFLPIPLLVNAIICIMSYKTGWVFFVSEQNQYIRGAFFLLPTLVSLIYFSLIIVLLNKNKEEYLLDNKILVTLILHVPILGAIFQIIFKDLLLMWGSVSISLILYYVLMREVQFNYDSQTGIKNRLAFDKEMVLCNNYKNVAIVVLDLNNLKKYNDKYGHKVGDWMINEAARIIQESFTHKGKAFRIGGDEFCVICKEIKMNSVNDLLSKLDNILNERNKYCPLKIEIAYGYAFVNDKSSSIHSVFNEADRFMYEHKAKLKGVYGRRIDD